MYVHRVIMSFELSKETLCSLRSLEEPFLDTEGTYFVRSELNGRLGHYFDDIQTVALQCEYWPDA